MNPMEIKHAPTFQLSRFPRRATTSMANRSCPASQFNPHNSYETRPLCPTAFAHCDPRQRYSFFSTRTFHKNCHPCRFQIAYLADISTLALFSKRGQESQCTGDCSVGFIHALLAHGSGHSLQCPFPLTAGGHKKPKLCFPVKPVSYRFSDKSSSLSTLQATAVDTPL